MDCLWLHLWSVTRSQSIYNLQVLSINQPHAKCSHMGVHFHSRVYSILCMLEDALFLVSNAFMFLCHGTNVPILQWQKQRLNTAGYGLSSEWTLQYCTYPVRLIQLQTLCTDGGEQTLWLMLLVSLHMLRQRRDNCFSTKYIFRYLSTGGGGYGEGSKRQNVSFLCGLDELLCSFITGCVLYKQWVMFMAYYLKFL